MPKRPDAASRAEKHWRSGRPSRRKAATSDATDALYGVTRPDVIGDFQNERSLGGLFADRDEECPCGSGESYYVCHGSCFEN